MARGFGYARLVKEMLKRDGNSIAVKKWLLVQLLSDISLLMIVVCIASYSYRLLKYFLWVLVSYENYSLEHSQQTNNSRQKFSRLRYQPISFDETCYLY